MKLIIASGCLLDFCWIFQGGMDICNNQGNILLAQWLFIAPSSLNSLKVTTTTTKIKAISKLDKYMFPLE